MTWTISNKLYAVFAAVVLLVGALGFVAVSSTGRLASEIDHIIDGTATGLEMAGELEYHVAELPAATQLTIIAAARRDADTIRQATHAIEEGYEELVKLADEFESHTQIERVKVLVRDVKANMAGWNEHATEVAHLAARYDLDNAATAFDKARAFSSKAHASAEQLFDLEKASLKQDQAESHDIYAAARTQTLIAIGLAVLVCVVALWIIRNVTSRLTAIAAELKEGAKQVADASSQVSATAQSLSQGATEQAASLEETSASMEEMAAMTRTNAQHSQQAATLMDEATGLVEGSNRALGEMVGSMSSIRESSDKVSRIIKTIDEIAFQTNILALNAAVEAARAGEAGMGFAVVADEVRNLAQRSAQAAKDTAALIEASITNTQEGSKKVEQVAASVSAITESLGKVKGIVDQVSEASRQQTQGIDQVTQAVSQMEKVTQATAASAEESAASSEELSAQAETSLGSISQLEEMVIGPNGTRVVKKASRPVVGVKMPKVLPMGSRQKSAALAPMANEEAFPLEDTGTFGKF